MGLILDTTILIASERRGESASDLLRGLTIKFPPQTEIGLSAVSAVEFTHGIYRSRTELQRDRRQTFANKIFADLVICPVTLEIAQLAGRIEGEQAAIGNIIAFPDLLIGATALHLGFSVATLNRRHFERIPGLQVVSL
jgi:predicted nucleic acid-binding protein